MKNRIKTNTINREPPKSDKVQIGGRVPAAMNMRLKISSDLTDLSKDQILADALACHYGIADSETLKRQKAVRDALKQLTEGVLPFEVLLTPLNSNALTGKTQSTKLTIRMGS